MRDQAEYKNRWCAAKMVFHMPDAGKRPDTLPSSTSARTKPRSRVVRELQKACEIAVRSRRIPSSRHGPLSALRHRRALDVHPGWLGRRVNREHAIDAITVATHGAAGALLERERRPRAAGCSDYEHDGPDALAGRL